VTGRAVVVGAGLAGIRAVQALRGKGYDAPITMIGAEPHLPYDRPPLSKEFLLGKLGPDDVRLVDDGAVTALDLDLRRGTRASGLDVGRREIIAGDERITFETLIIATGSTPRRLAAAGRLAGVHPLRSVDDAVAIRAALAAEARVAVVGGGFIGAEVASAARLLGLEVTIVDPLPALMMRGLGPVVGAALAERHRDNGVRVLLGRSVARIEGYDRVERLTLDDGSVLEVDVVVVGVGVDPAVGWLAGSGLDIADGVACDASLRAAPGIYAVGDVARFATPDGHRRAEHWTNAVDQAAVVAAGITGTTARYAPLPYVWSDQLGTRLQVWGDIRTDDTLRCVHGSPGAAEFVLAADRGGQMCGVVALGARREAMRAQRLLQSGGPWPPGLPSVAPTA
jgi:NADPH-dependent 2,4-dienoyl-CoA reductase/sulfur reductase-like enzyme